MKLLWFVLLSFFVSASFLFSYEVKESNYILGMNNVLSITKINEKVYILGIDKTNKKPIIGFLLEDKWNPLPNTILKNGNEEEMLIDHYAYIRFDLDGNIWLNGKYSMYSYKDGIWSGYSIDDGYKDKRTIDQFCIGTDNIIWIATSIISSDYNNAELFKFDGQNFTSVYTSTNPYSFMKRTSNPTISALDNGRVIFHKNYATSFEEVDLKGYNPDLYIIQNEEIVDSLKILTSSGEDFDNYNKAVSFIYYEEYDKLWVGTIDRVYDDDGKTKVCCSGLSLYSDDYWTVFNSDNNFGNDERSIQTFAMCKVNEDSYLFITSKNIYHLKDNYFNIIEWKDIFKNAYFIRANDYYSGDKLKEYFNSLESNNSISLILKNIEYLNNSEIALVFNAGILILNLSDILPVSVHEEEYESQNDFIIYPNPIDDYLNISNPEEKYLNFEIYSLSGEKLKTGRIMDKINCFELVSGVYFIRLYDKNMDYLIMNFIKK